MKNSKVRFLPIFALFAAILLLPACSHNKKEHGLDPRDPQEITVWNYYNGAQAIAFEDAVEEFNNTVGLDTGIIVTAQSKSSVEDLSQALNDSANEKVGAEDMPNIFQCYTDMATVLDEKRILTDLNQYMPEDEKNNYIDNYIEEGTWDDTWKLFPVAKGTEIMALNKTDWDVFASETGAEVSSLSTWEGLQRVSQEYYEWSGGRSFFGRDAFANYIIIGCRQLGNEIFTVKDGKVAIHLEKDVMRRLWDNFYIPYIKGYYKHIGRYRSDDVKIGEILCCVCSTSGMTYFPKEVTFESEDPYPIETLVLPVPNFEGEDPYAVQQGASMAVAKSTDRAEYASVLFLKWFTQPENNIKYAIQSGYLPVTKQANSYEKIEKYLAENETSFDETEKATMQTAIQQVNNSTLYTSSGFDKGEAARSVLSSSMLDLAINDRKQILRQIADGISEEKAMKGFLTDSYFETWLNNLEQELHEACQ